MKLDKRVVDMFTELTKPADDVKMEKTCYGTISVVDGTRYVKLDGSDLLVPAASTVKTSHGDRVTVLMKNHSLTVTGNLTAPATDGEGGSSGEAGTAATIEIGTVTTGEAGSSAAVTNSGTTSAAVFDFVIPRGDKGEKGDTGPQGEKGDTGTWDGTIPDHEHTVSDITDFPTSLPANGGNADTIDGLHAADLFQKSEGLRSENMYYDIFSATLTSDHPCWNKHCFVFGLSDDIESEMYIDNAPEISYALWYEVFTCGNTYGNGRAYQIAFGCYSHQRKTFIRYMHDGVWSGWYNIADGGNADTVDGFHANEIASNPNLLINPDFRINQRGKDSYTGVSAITYTVDRWYIWKYNCDAYGTVTVNNDGSLSVDGVNGANDAILTQELENGAELVGKTVTLSLEIEEIAGSIIVQQHYNASSGLTVSAPGIHKVTFEWQEAIKYRIVILNTNCSHYKIKWMKLEHGSIATPFCPPDPATELAKCQRYAMTLESLTRFHSTLCNDNIIDFFIPTSTTLRTTPTIPTNGVSMSVRDVKNHFYAGFSLIVLNVSSNGFVVRATKENHGLTEAILEISNRLIISAEL